MKSAVVLAGGSSSRMGMDKGLLKLAGKPLLSHVIEAINSTVDEIVVVTNSQNRIEEYSQIVSSKVRFALDQGGGQSPLVGAMSGFAIAQGEYSLLLPFDLPFVSNPVISLLFDLCKGRVACIPRHPNGQIEPLHAVYDTIVARKCAKTSVLGGRLDMRGMIEKMNGVRYVSTLVLKKLDPSLYTLFNVNTLADLKKAEHLATLGLSLKSGVPKTRLT